MRKRYLFLSLAVIIIITGVLVWACKDPTGPGIIGRQQDKGDGASGINNYSTSPNLFDKSRQIPALTVTKNNVILATAGTTNGPLTIKRSSDNGNGWYETKVNGTQAGVGYIHPFFINCHNGDILLGVISNKSSSKQTIIFRSSDGQNWRVETNISFSEICKDTTDCFVTYGQGITLRHGNNGNDKLMFPYFYTNSKAGDRYTASMLSGDDGKTFTNSYSDNSKYSYGKFTSYETKFIELSDGNILLNVRSTKESGNTEGKMFWMLSTNCGKSWEIKTWATNAENTDTQRLKAKHADFVRYEFNGTDIIKTNGGDKYALMICSYENTNGYRIMMTTNDFNNGEPETTNVKKYVYTKELTSGTGYPAITVLRDGTIATLTEENNGIVFKTHTFNGSQLN